MSRAPILPPTLPAAQPVTFDSVLIAHRGEPSSYPENSLPGYRAVLAAGARYVETDVQLSADGVAVLSHDASLRRITGQDIDIRSHRFDRLQQLAAAHTQRFGDRFAALRLGTLGEFVELLQQWPEVTTFVELKSQSYASFGAKAVDRLLAQLDAIAAQSVVIAFEPEVLERVRRDSRLPIGWILPEWSDTSRERAERLAPEYLFVNRKRLPARPASLWPGPWRWAVYTVNRREEVLRALSRGFSLVETDCASALLQQPTAGRHGDGD